MVVVARVTPEHYYPAAMLVCLVISVVLVFHLVLVSVVVVLTAQVVLPVGYVPN